MGKMLEVAKDFMPDYKIGTIDLECCLESKSINGGPLFVYAGAYSVQDETKTYWLGEGKYTTNNSIIVNLFSDLLNSKFTDHSFYIHNSI